MNKNPTTKTKGTSRGHSGNNNHLNSFGEDLDSRIGSADTNSEQIVSSEFHFISQQSSYLTHKAESFPLSRDRVSCNLEMMPRSD